MLARWIHWWACLTVIAAGIAHSHAAEPEERCQVVGYALLDQEGDIHRIGETKGTRAVALTFLSTECPVANRYLQDLGEMADHYADQGVEFYGVFSDPTLAWSDVAHHAKEFAVRFPLLFDASGDLGRMLAPTHVPEVFVVSKQGVVRYRGRIDDRFASVNQRRAVIRQHDLRAALDAVLAGERVETARTEPVGCRWESNLEVPVTYSRQIAPILHARCAGCHRPGEVAPFQLLSYEDAAKRSAWIRDVVETALMPPWKARPSDFAIHGERRLRENEIRLITRWAETGAPLGEPSEAPPTPEFAEGWTLGEPDLIVEMPTEFEVPASGPDIYRFFVLPIDIPDDRQIVAAEFRAGNPRVVHQSVLYLDSSGKASQLDAATPEEGYEGFLTGGFIPSGVIQVWAPGMSPVVLPENVAIPVSKGTVIAMQMHYHPSGKQETDRSRVGLHFAKKPVENNVALFALNDFRVDIPPGEDDYAMGVSLTLPAEITINQAFPHMHYLGTWMEVTATLPDGEVRTLVSVDWDFDWQESYTFSEPVTLPKGTRLDLKARFDNSEKNPANPSSPPQRVRFGEETTDEMCLCIFQLIGERKSENVERVRRALLSGAMAQILDPEVRERVIAFAQRGTGAEDDLSALRMLFKTIVP